MTKSSATRAMGEAFRAALKDKHAHQKSVCVKLGISYRTHKYWMAQEADEGSELEAYQREVMLGLVEQEAASLDAMEDSVKAAKASHATPTFNMLKWRHEQRFRGLHDEPVQKIEITNNVQNMSDAELAAALAKAEKGEGGE